MSLLYTLVAAAQLSTLVSAAPLLSSPLTKRFSYKQYTGSGSLANGWPQQTSWQSFDSMFSANMDIMKNSCTQWSVDNNSDQEIADLKSAISSVADSTNIPAQFILAIVLQESNGCVRVPTTTYSVRNPGLMQDHDGTGTCNDGSVKNPCPSSEIMTMIKEGVEGTSEGDGLQQCISKAGTNDVSKYYRAARIYNSGSIVDDDLSLGVATHCYASDIANRLTGWSTGPSACIGSPVAGPSSPEPSSAPATTPSSVPVPSPPSTPKPSPTSIAVPPTVPTPNVPKPTAPKPTVPKPHFTAPSFSGIASALPPLASGSISNSPADDGAKQVGDSPSAVAPAPTSAASSAAPSATPSAPAAAAPASGSSSAELAPGVPASCPQLYTVVDDDNCWTLGQKFGFSFADFQAWNSENNADGHIDAACSNLWKGYQYCVKGA